MKRLSVPLLITALLAVPATAAAATTFKGTTSQGGSVIIVLDSKQRLARYTIDWSARCDERDTPFERATEYAPPPSARKAKRFASSGKYTVKRSGAVRWSISVDGAGEQTSDTRWEGRFAASIVIRRSGKVVDRCRTGRITWSATR